MTGPEAPHVSPSAHLLKQSIAALTGAALFVLASPSVGAAFLVPLSISCVCWSAVAGLAAGAGRTFLAGWVIGLGYAGALFYWLFGINTWGAMLTIAGFACMPAFLALAVRAGLKAIDSPTLLSLWVACSWVTLEFLASDNLFPLPPYGLAYYLWQWPVFLQSADLVGSYGVSFWLAFLGAAMGFTCLGQARWSAVALPLVLGLALGVHGAWRMSVADVKAAEGGTLDVAVLRTLRVGEEKRDPQTLQEMMQVTTQDYSAGEIGAGRADLIVWPETAVPLWLRSFRQRELVRDLLSLSAEIGTPMIIGAHAVEVPTDAPPRRYNAAFLVPPRGYIAQEYHKVLLAPGVEMVPFAAMLPESLAERWPSRLDAGEDPGVFRLNDGTAVGVFICWEVFFPGFVRQLPRDGAQLLVNMSNDEAAFGGLASAYRIPLPQLVMRAIENRRHLVRSANGGPSVIVDSYGRLQAVDDAREERLLRATVPVASEVTVYTRHGDIAATTLALLTFLGGAWMLWMPRRVKD